MEEQRYSVEVLDMRRAANRDLMAISLERESIKNLAGVSLGDTVAELGEAQNYLRRFGFLEAGQKFKRGNFDAPTARALNRFYQFNGLPQAPELTDGAIELMTNPRCGMADVSPLGFNIVNPWDRRDLTFAFGQSSTQAIDFFEAQAAVWRAILTWVNVGVGIQFTEVGTGDNPDVLVEWQRSVAQDHNLIGIDHAHADFPPASSANNDALPLPVHFDDDEPDWKIGDDIDIESVALHEFGHILGLDHQGTESTGVMWPFYAGVRTTLHADDIAGLQALYPAN